MKYNATGEEGMDWELKKDVERMEKSAAAYRDNSLKVVMHMVFQTLMGVGKLWNEPMNNVETLSEHLAIILGNPGCIVKQKISKQADVQTGSAYIVSYSSTTKTAMNTSQGITDGSWISTSPPSESWDFMWIFHQLVIPPPQDCVTSATVKPELHSLDLNTFHLAKPEHTQMWARETLSCHGPVPNILIWTTGILRGILPIRFVEESNMVEYLKFGFMAPVGEVKMHKASTAGYPLVDMLQKLGDDWSQWPETLFQDGRVHLHMVYDILSKQQQQKKKERKEETQEDASNGPDLLDVWNQLVSRESQHGIIFTASLQISPSYQYQPADEEERAFTMSDLSFFIAHLVKSRLDQQDLNMRCSARPQTLSRGFLRAQKMMVKTDKPRLEHRAHNLLEWEVNGPLLEAPEGPKMIRTRVQIPRVQSKLPKRQGALGSGIWAMYGKQM
ncbi:hypothetical protein BDR05DRAFT_952086 [Suillus weaverae]|nr:hypothetical protein BDR05DRAFT_952086 [Suillus weaverae]